MILIIFFQFSTTDNDESHLKDILQDLFESANIAQEENTRLFPFSYQCTHSVISQIIFEELPNNLIGALISVFLCTLFFLGNLTATFAICATISITLIDVAGKYDYMKKYKFLLHFLQWYNLTKMDNFIYHRIYVLFGIANEHSFSNTLVGWTWSCC